MRWTLPFGILGIPSHFSLGRAIGKITLWFGDWRTYPHDQSGMGLQPRLNPDGAIQWCKIQHPQLLMLWLNFGWRAPGNVGGNRSPGCCQSRPLSDEEWVWLGIEPTTSEVTGADVSFEHRSYHCATLTAEGLMSGRHTSLKTVRVFWCCGSRNY
jgi:hypothetical protein